MEKTRKSNRAPLIAAAFVVTGATAVFGTYAATDEMENGIRISLTEEQKSGLEQARELFKQGNKEEAKALLDRLELNKLDGEMIFHEKHQKFISNLTEEQKSGLKKAKKLFHEGKEVEARALLEKLKIDLPEKFAIKLNLTEEQKAKLKEAKKLREAGDLEGAQAIMKEFGLPMGKFMGPRFDLIKDLTEEQRNRFKEAHEMMMNGEEEKARAIFEELALPFPEKHFFKMNLTEEQKTVMKKAHTLRKEGKLEEAEKILKEAGIDMPKGPHFLFHELTDEQKAGMKKVRELMEAGQKEEAQELIESLDLPMPPVKKMVRWMDKAGEEDVMIRLEGPTQE